MTKKKYTIRDILREINEQQYQHYLKHEPEFKVNSHAPKFVSNYGRDVIEGEVLSVRDEPIGNSPGQSLEVWQTNASDNGGSSAST